MTDIELIEKFYSNELSGEESEIFRDKYNSDLSFKQECDNFSKVLIALNSISKKQVNRKETMSTDSAKKTNGDSNLKVIFRAAAIFIPLIIISNIGYYLFTGKSSDDIFNNYYSESQVKSLSFYINNEAKFKDNLNEINLSTLSVLDNFEDDEELLSFGLYCMNGYRFSEAVMIFKRLIGLDKFVEESEWYLGLCYLKTGRTEEAVYIIKRIKENPQHKKYKEAKKILPKIKS